MIARGLGGRVESLSLWPVRVTTPDAVHLRAKLTYDGETARIINRRGTAVEEVEVADVVHEPPGWRLLTVEGPWDVAPIRGGCNCQADVVVSRG